MKQVLNVEIKNYNITITDDDFSKTMEELNLLTASQKRLLLYQIKF